MRFTLYGFGIRSELPIPGLTSAVDGAVDVEIAFRTGPGPTSGDLDRVSVSPSLTVRRGNGYYQFAYRDGTEFVVARDGSRVTAFSPSDATHEDTCTYLVGPVLGFVLRQRGVVCLHASVAVIHGRAVVLCGAAGAGKSSTAAALARAGHPILAEDVAPLDDGLDGFAVQPGYPRVNLWPDAAEALCGPANALPAITPTWEKRYLPLAHGGGAGPSFHPEPAPLAAIYVLAERIPCAQPEIRALAPVDALLALLANTYTPYLLDEAMRAREFDVLGRLVKTIPVRRLSPPEDIACMPGLCDALLADFAKLGGRS